ncbi:MAG: hypothetical protein WAV32_03680 [Halobacteriota archaeon]
MLRFAITFGWEVDVKSVYDGLPDAKVLKTMGAVDEKFKYH